MQVYFLSAKGVKLAKTFKADGSVEPYPHVSRFYSHVVDVHGLGEFLRELENRAAWGHCLIKGQLTRTLAGESRAGATIATDPTEWLCLDFDFEDGDPDDLLQQMGLGEVDYIWHHSSSAGLRSQPGIRGHAFILLHEKVPAPLLKQWFQSLNLQLAPLVDRLELSANGMALRWPLDITTCQNDKLIYIADPVVEGRDDPLAGRRFELRERGRERWVPDFSRMLKPHEIQREINKRINILRKQRGLPERKPRTTIFAGTEVLENPDRAVVTGEKVARGFVYLNLNGGDSWGYYYPEGNPEILYNFKGEPAVRLKKLDPDYYGKAVAKHAAKLPNDALLEVAYNLDDDAYYIVMRQPGMEHPKLYPIQKTNIKNYLKSQGREHPGVIEPWTIEFNPTTTRTFDPSSRYVNLYRPTPFILKAAAHAARGIPPGIEQLLRNITVDAETFEHMLNWLAYKFQKRERSGTGWILHGETGTGKGLFFSSIIRPLFGPEYCKQMPASKLVDNFNPDLECALFLFVDETRFTDRDRRIVDELKYMVTEPMLQIRAMRRARREAPNYLSVIIASNATDPIPLEPNDRRFNVAPFHRRKINPRALEGFRAGQFDPTHLQDFANYLAAYKVDLDRALTPLDNRARQEMLLASETAADRFFRALREGELDFFVERLSDSEAPPASDFVVRQRWTEAQNVVRSWVSAALQQGAAKQLRIQDLRQVYDALVSSSASATRGGMSRVKFERMLSIRGILFEGGAARNLELRVQRIPLPELRRFLREEGNHGAAGVDGVVRDG